MATLLAPIEVFCSYAHEDEEWRRKLERHLSPLQQQGLISVWNDRLIIPGTNWTNTIDQHLESASIILLLISADFFSSDYCSGIEMKRALERQEANEAVVIPILVRPTEWQDAPFASLQALPTDARPLASWSDEEQALTDVVAGIRRVVENMPLLTASAPRTALPKIWNIPYSRNPFFLGREQELSLIHQQLQTGPTALSQPQAISGLGGIGKTQLALEYAYRYHQEYEIVLWVAAASIETLTSSYSSVASLLRLPEREAKEQEVIVQAVKKWLQNHRDWLLILDNADELALLPDFLPPTFGGHLLLTTRALSTGRLAYRMEVETLLPEQGALLLLRRAGLLDPIAPLEQASSEQREVALRLSQDFGGLPLALDQAGAYLEETGIDLASYARLYQQYRAVLLNERRGLVNDHPAPVATTWSLSFEHVKQKNPAAAQLLHMAAFLSPDAIPEELFTEGASVLDPMLAVVTTDPLHFNQALETLLAYSLIHRNPSSKTLSVHRLVQTVLQDTLQKEEQRHWAEQVMFAINRVFPDVKHESWPQCERLLAHALLAAQWIEQYQFTCEEAGRLLNHTGVYLYYRGRYSESAPLLQQALAINEKVLGPEHPKIATSLNDLANVYENQGKYEDALLLSRRALAINEKMLGPEHPETATSLSTLAYLYQGRGKYDEALPLLQRSLTINEKTLGAEHPDTASMLNILAVLYYLRGNYGEASLLFKRVLTIRKKVLGPEHPATATGINNLAFIYQHQGKFKEALPLYQQALEIREKVLGPEHPDTAASLNNLASFYGYQGNYEEALVLSRRALTIDEKVLGADHLNTAADLNTLALLYCHQGKYNDAEPLYQRALRIREQQLGPEHPRVAETLHNLAELYWLQSKYTDAEPLYQRALRIREQQLSLEHSDTAETLHKYAAFLEMQGKQQEALSLYQRALAIREKVLGPEHPRTKDSRQRLTALMQLDNFETGAVPEDEMPPEWSGQPT